MDASRKKKKKAPTKRSKRGENADLDDEPEEEMDPEARASFLSLLSLSRHR